MVRKALECGTWVGTRSNQTQQSKTNKKRKPSEVSEGPKSLREFHQIHKSTAGKMQLEVRQCGAKVPQDTSASVSAQGAKALPVFSVAVRMYVEKKHRLTHLLPNLPSAELSLHYWFREEGAAEKQMRRTWSN